jgi:hypothetical protein
MGICPIPEICPVSGYDICPVSGFQICQIFKIWQI